MPIRSPSLETLHKLEQLIAEPGEAQDRTDRFPTGLQVAVVKCVALTSTSPIPHYSGRIQWTTALAGRGDAGTGTVILADLNGGELEVETYYFAVRAGFNSGVPIYWTVSLVAGPGDGPGPRRSWAIGLTEDDCLKLTVLSAAGKCSAISTAQVLTLTWDDTAAGWLSTTDLATDAGDTAVLFWLEAGRVRLNLEDINYEMFLEELGPGYAIFAGGTPSAGGLCNGTSAGTCADNTFRVKVECKACPGQPGCPDTSGSPPTAPTKYAHFTGAASFFGTVALNWNGTEWVGVSMACGGGVTTTFRFLKVGLPSEQRYQLILRQSNEGFDHVTGQVLATSCDPFVWATAAPSTGAPCAQMTGGVTVNTTP